MRAADTGSSSKFLGQGTWVRTGISLRKGSRCPVPAGPTGTGSRRHVQPARDVSGPGRGRAPDHGPAIRSDDRADGPGLRGADAGPDPGAPAQCRHGPDRLRPDVRAGGRPARGAAGIRCPRPDVRLGPADAGGAAAGLRHERRRRAGAAPDAADDGGRGGGEHRPRHAEPAAGRDRAGTTERAAAAGAVPVRPGLGRDGQGVPARGRAPRPGAEAGPQGAAGQRRRRPPRAKPAPTCSSR